MKALRVVKPGLFTTIQDLGRYGYLRYGVPACGAMDTFSLVAANLLVGNESNDACLETTLIGPELQALTRIQIAITGGDCAPRINEQSIPMWQVLTIEKGDVVSLGRMETGCRAYISVRGGISVLPVLGSRSTYVRARFGGMDGRQLKTGDVVEGFGTSLVDADRRIPEHLIPQFNDYTEAHVVLGPQVDMFTEKGASTFLSGQYRVTPESDRMGYRLDGPLIEHRGKADIVSDALLPGAIQVPKDGKPIVIMRDAQTTGGYAKIAVIVTSDLPLVGQASPGSVIGFSKITLKEAHQKLRSYRRLLENLGSVLVKT